MSYLTVLEVAERLRVCDVTVRRMIREGRLPGVFIGSQGRIDSEEFEKWLEEQRPANRKSPT